jgi:transposase InsO family protein
MKFVRSWNLMLGAFAEFARTLIRERVVAGLVAARARGHKGGRRPKLSPNRQVYDDIPHVRHKGPKPTPQPHPYKAEAPHQYWFIDGRKMDFALEDGAKWWSLSIVDGYARTMLAGAVAPVEARGVALMVLYTAYLRYGAPAALISDSGSAFTSNEFEAVCTRLQIDHKPIESTRGESYLNWMETHFNVQRRLYDDQFSLTTTPLEFEQAHQAFMHLYNTTAHHGLLKDQFDPPIPLVVLGEAKGRTYSPEELDRKFSRALFPRTTNRSPAGSPCRRAPGAPPLGRPAFSLAHAHRSTPPLCGTPSGAGPLARAADGAVDRDHPRPWE